MYPSICLVDYSIIHFDLKIERNLSETIIFIVIKLSVVIEI